MRLRKAQNVSDLRTIARARLPRVAFDYIDGAVEDEIGLARGRAAFAEIEIVPRYMVEIENRNLETTVFGRRYAAPFGIGPTGLNGLAWPGADLALARAAAEADIPFVLSTVATTTVEDAMAAVPDHGWFQLYVPRDPSVREDLVRRADEAGAHALMVTVDVPTPSKRERDIRNSFMLPLRPTASLVFDLMTHPGWSLQLLTKGMPNFVNLKPYADPGAGVQTLAGYISAQMSGAVTWETIDWLRSAWKKPLLIKGVMSAEDAARAVDHGVDGLVVSNHGGRQLDSAPAPIDVLPAIRDAVGGALTLIVDGGVRRGPDIAKALALGADFVFVGRATLYGVAAGGPAGAKKAIHFLRDELERCLAQIGCPDVGNLRNIEINRRRSG